MYNRDFSDQREVKMYNQQAYEERLYIETALKHKQSIEQIATTLNRAVSTIRREIQRNRTNVGLQERFQYSVVLKRLSLNPDSVIGKWIQC